MTTKEIQMLVGKVQVLKGHNPVVENISIFSPEMDIFSLSQSGYVYEFEVKISKADYKKDSEKKMKHTLLELGHGDMPNYFSYVCPQGLIKGHEVPKYAGLFYVLDAPGTFPALQEIVKAPLLHRGKPDPLKIFTKACRVHSERNFLGDCKMTFLNKKIKRDKEDLLREAGFAGEILKNALKRKT